MGTVGCQALLKLPERPLHEALCLLRRVDPEQVEGHVVARQELRLDDERRAHRDLVDGADLDVGLLEDHAVADHVDATPARASHELGQLARREVRKADSIELRERRDDHSARRHVDAKRKRLGREDHLDQPTLEELLDHLLVIGQEAGVMFREAAAQQPRIDHPAKQRFFVAIL